MNLSQVKKLKDGDTVTFVAPLPSFTLGKKYTVRKTDCGFYIYDNIQWGFPLSSELHLETYFSKLK